jgi:hypothetical protein
MRAPVATSPIFGGRPTGPPGAGEAEAVASVVGSAAQRLLVAPQITALNGIAWLVLAASWLAAKAVPPFNAPRPS